MKHLKLEVLRLPEGWGGGAHVRIVEQTHRGKAFGENYHIFFPMEGLPLDASKWPHLYLPDMDVFYVRGPKKPFGRYDNNSIYIEDPDNLSAIIAAVREYNKYFSDKPKSEPKPQTGKWVVETVE